MKSQDKLCLINTNRNEKRQITRIVQKVRPQQRGFF